MGGMYFLIAKKISKKNYTFSKWLEDVSDRPAPFMDFDLRGLDDADRKIFYACAREAFDELKEVHGDDVIERESAYSARNLARLIQMYKKILKNEEPALLNDLDHIKEFDGSKIDFNDIWE
ncbi:hypothetical protein [Zooshikella ganghwensis]|nr:hypothetical protein [Zooshikella ganghwensis]